MSQNNQQPTTKQSKPMLRFFLAFLVFVFFILVRMVNYSTNLAQSTQTSTISVSSEINKTQNSVKISEIIAKKEGEVLKQLEEKVEKKSEEIEINQELIYMTQMKDILESLIKPRENISNFGLNNLSYTEWTVENKTYIATQIIIMKNSYKKFQEIKPPNEYQEMHNTIIEASKFGGYAADDLVNGIDNHSTFLINSATKKIKSSDESISSASSKIMKVFENKRLGK